MPVDSEESESRDIKNRRIVEALRKEFQIVAERLTSEIEPATIYAPAAAAFHPQDAADKELG